MTRCSCLLALLFTVLPRVASAQSAANEAKAKALFEEGRELAANQQYERACSKFEQSLKLASGIGTTYNLAKCELKLGHFARAHRLFTHAAAAARELGQHDRARVAEADAQAIEPRLALVRIEFESLESDRELRLDGELLNANSRIATALADPGKHRLSASSNNEEYWAYEFEASAGAAITILVPRAAARSKAELATAVAAVEPSNPTTSPESTRPPAQPAPTPPPQEARSDGPPTMFWVLASGGVAGLATGAVFGVKFLNANSAAKDICPSSYGCSTEEMLRHLELVDDATKARTASFIGFGAGAALMTTAVIVLVTQPSPAKTGRRTPALPASFQASRSGFSLALQGEF